MKFDIKIMAAILGLGALIISGQQIYKGSYLNDSVLSANGDRFRIVEMADHNFCLEYLYDDGWTHRWDTLNCDPKLENEKRKLFMHLETAKFDQDSKTVLRTVVPK